MHDAFYLKHAGRDLYRAIAAMTRVPGLHGLTLRPAPFSPLLIQARDCEDLFLPGLPRDSIFDSMTLHFHGQER